MGKEDKRERWGSRRRDSIGFTVVVDRELTVVVAARGFWWWWRLGALLIRHREKERKAKKEGDKKKNKINHGEKMEELKERETDRK